MISLKQAYTNFIELVSKIFPLSILVIQNVTKQATFMTQSQNLKIWRTRTLELCFQKGILYIIKDCQRKKDKLIDLNDYQVFYVGMKDKKHCFKLKSISTYNRYPSFMIGCADATQSQLWYNYVMICKNTYFSQDIQMMENDTYLTKEQVKECL